MRIGLIDVDGHNFPNLPLMKLSAYHKSIGDSVEWYEPMFSGHMDKVYMSKVFTFAPDYEYCIDADEIIKGGTGYSYPDGGKALADEIEHIYPDYSIYYEKLPDVKNTAYGFEIDRNFYERAKNEMLVFEKDSQMDISDFIGDTV